MKPLILTLLLTLSGSLAWAQSEMSETTIAVTGTGTVYAEPDLATFDVGVSAFQEDVIAASEEVSGRVSRLIATLQSLGVAEQDIRTVDVSIFPEQNYNRDGELTGTRFRVVNRVRVSVRDTSQLSTLLGRSIQTGANEVSNVRYTFADPKALEDQARAQAMDAARDKAEQLAELAEVELGAVQRIVEQGGGAQPMPQARMMQMEAAASDMPVSAGQLSVSVSLQVNYAVAQPTQE